MNPIKSEGLPDLPSNNYCITFHDPRDFCRFASIIIGATYLSERDALKRFDDGSLFGERTWGKVTACEAGRASHAAPIPSVDAVVGEPVAISEREIAEALRRHGLSLVKTEVGYEVESLSPFVAEIDYTPGNWFMAKSVDDMRAFFLSRLPAIREAAQGCGYAIGLHGSERRDFDLIAVPWRDGCDSPDALARALAIAACGLTRQGAYDWETKPLGRIAVSIPICWCEKWADDMAGAGHIDLSVMAPNSAQIARLTIDRDDAIADTKEIRARWNDAENEFALAASVASRAQTEWVSVEDRLPDSYLEVWISNWEGVSLAIWSDVDKGFVRQDVQGSYESVDSPRHWMPTTVPTPPVTPGETK